jgi:superfamily II DNA or RNA helicase
MSFPAPTYPESAAWIATLNDASVRRAPDLLDLAQQAVAACPRDGQVLYLAAVAALRAGDPGRAQTYHKRLRKHFVTDARDALLDALILAAQGALGRARDVLRRDGIVTVFHALRSFPGDPRLDPWVGSQVEMILAVDTLAEAKAVARHVIKASARPARPSAPAPTRADAASTPPDFQVPDLPRYAPDIPLDIVLPDAAAPFVSPPTDEAFDWFRLRAAFAHLGLLQGFDELLCLPLLHQVDTYWYQVETVRKVLKTFRGRVLLADEVGLGKTIEAGMVLKEYLLRGMVERVLILTPASLVGQWREELAAKFDIPCATTYDSLLRSDPDAFWAQPCVIASLATARRQETMARLTQQTYDLVIVDEAHHLKSRSTRNYQLVDALRKRFLLLLSATPVQNSLVELYNLLTLLKPGIFNTEKEFRAAYMTPGKPRVPANRERMRDLMRDVMIRNTRALVDVRLPARHAVTLRLDAGAEEQACYQALDALVREMHAGAPGHHRLALHHLLSAAGSSPAAAVAALHRFITRDDPRWRALYDRYAALDVGVKEQALLDVLRRNPDEKVMVFVHHHETLEHLDALLRAHGIAFARFDGSMSGPEKDAAIATFRDQAPVLLSTQSGGEGRNVQFCHTLVNYDLPWNPMVIEQRIGRVHRIGQTREVFVFNLAARGTLESEVLRILDEKINMFELVVGEIDAILGEMDEEQDFAETVFTTWVESTAQAREDAFAELGNRVVKAREQYEAVKTLDSELFGDEFEAG